MRAWPIISARIRRNACRRKPNEQHNNRCTRLIAHKGGGSLHTTLVLTMQKFVAFVVSVLFLSPDSVSRLHSLSFSLHTEAVDKDAARVYLYSLAAVKVLSQW